MINNALLKAMSWFVGKQAEIAENRANGESGQGVVEYAVVIGVIVVGVVGLFQLAPVGQAITAVVCNLENIPGVTINIAACP